MAQRKKSEVEFIQDTFCPQVAVLCSYDAEVVCRKNSLTFVELVQPFCRFNGEIKISDPSNNLITISNLRVEIKDINSMPPPPLIAKKLLDESVSNGLSSPQYFIEKPINLNSYNFVANINTPWFESWRECFIKIGYPDDHEFLKHFLACIFVVSTSHLDPLDQFQKLILQQQQPQPQPNTNRLPKWLFPNVQSIYKYFVLLHDVQEGEISKAHQIYENLKNTYGSSNCHLLQINSKSVSSTLQQQPNQQQIEFDPWLQYCKFNDLYSNNTNQYAQQLNDSLNQSIIDDIDTSLDNDNLVNNNPLINKSKPLSNGSVSNVKRHGVCLALSDHDRIKTFINEFLQRGLVPYVERTIKILNEQIQSKKSILKTFGISKRLFGGGSSSNSIKASSSSTAVVSMSGLTNQTGSSSSSNSSITITNSSTFAGTNDELQIRRLADLAFMFRLYDVAFNSYHTCKKEFTSFINNSSNQSNTEQLLNMTLYLAGALEMASISNFMQNFSADLHHSSTLAQSTSTSSISSIQSSPSTSSTSSSLKSYNFTYIDEAIQLMLNTCKNTYFATRCALLSTEALKTINQFYKAAFQFISLASDDSDIRSALFLEQAAQCYLAIQNPQPSIRKYAFFMSIAGYRFNKAGQRKHAIRVYKHALDIYENRCWYKAQDHLNFVMSRLNFNLRNIQEALSHIENILIKKKLAQKLTNYQTDSIIINKNYTNIIEFSNETNILKDYILYSNTLINESKQLDKLPSIPVPLIDASNLKLNLYPGDKLTLKHGRILVHSDIYMDYLIEPISLKEKELLNSLNNASPVHTITTDTTKQTNDLKEMWLKYEQALYVNTYRTSVPILFKPHVTLFDQTTDNRQMPKAVLNEPLAVMFEIKNHLRINLIITEVTLLWKFQSDDEETQREPISNEVNKSLDHIAECSSIKELNLTPFETYKLRLHLIPKQSNGTLSILGIKYRLGLASFTSSLSVSMISNNLTSSDSESTTANQSNELTSLYGKQLFEIKGPRLNNSPANMRSIVYDVDQRLNLKILNEMPLLQIELDHLPSRMQCDQLEKVKLFFINLNSHKQIGNLKIASNGVVSSCIYFRKRENTNSSKLEFNQMVNLNKSDFKFKENESVNDKPISKTIGVDNELVYSLDDVIIEPNDVYELDMWIRGPNKSGEHKFYFMFFYKEVNPQVSTNTNAFKYRIIRYEFKLQTVSSMSLNSLNVINSNTSSNLLINIEALIHQPSFELVDSVSVSDIWKTRPINKTTKNFQTTSSSFEDILSLTLKAEPVKSNDNQVCLLRSQYSNSPTRDQLPDEDVFFHFIRSDLKTHFLNADSPKSSFLNIYFIWKSISKDDDYIQTNCNLSMIRAVDEHIETFDLNKTLINYNEIQQQQQKQQQMIKKFEYRLPTGSANLNNSNKSNFNMKNLLKNFLSVTSKCNSKVFNDFNLNKMCQVSVSVELRNLSNTHDFDLIVLARNNLKKSITELDKSYVWLGCTKRYIRLEANRSKQVKLKLGFYSNGMFEIGDQSNKLCIGDFRLNLFDSTSSSLNINTNNNVTIVLDDLNDTLTSVIDANNSSANNPILSSNNLLSADSKSGCIFIFNKNSLTNRYELFKCLNTFTVTII